MERGADRPGGAASDPPEHGGGARDWRPLALGALLLAVIAVVVVVVVDGDGERLENPTAADVAQDPTLYAGAQVSIAGDVDAVYELPPADPDDDPRRAFELATNEDQGLLVVATRDADPPQANEGDSVQAEGTIQGFYAGGFRGTFGALPTGATPWGTAERPVLLATDVSQAANGGAEGS